VINQIDVLSNTWPEGRPALDSIKEKLGNNFKFHAGLSGKADLVLYVRIPWNVLLKQCVKEVPEFKENTEARRELKQSLLAMEKTLDSTVTKLEEKLKVLVVDGTDLDSPQEIETNAHLIKIAIRGN
jgi:hypothetical protein